MNGWYNVSGTLVSYLLLRELRLSEGPLNINWLKIVVHRYLRCVCYSSSTSAK